MFSLRHLVHKLRDLNCPDPIAHVRMLRTFCGTPDRRYFQCVAVCNPKCQVPDRIASDMWQELQERRLTRV